MKFTTSDKSHIQQHLTTWFKKNQRDLPWRKNYDPYEVWVSEIMLQQTQVTTVLPYFDRWMKTLPTIESVANAPEDQILKLWEGLGYYSRARNLQKAAQEIMEKHGGKFPSKYDDILALKGVGKYTAGAIASIAFNQEQPIVDGNVIRVLARLTNYPKNTRLPENIKDFWAAAEQLIPKSEARYFNQGMMELGALICKPTSPKCGECPIQKSCQSNAKGNQESLPNRGEKQALTQIKVSIAVIKKGDKVFIQKRPSKGLMGGLWEFPGGKLEKGETAKKGLEREIKEELGIKLKNIKPIKKIKHGYTKFRVDLNCFTADYESGTIKLNSATKGKWVKLEELRDYPFPAANVRLIAELMSE